MKLSLVTGNEKIDDCIEYGLRLAREAAFIVLAIATTYLITITNTPYWLFAFITIGCAFSAVVFCGVIIYNTMALLGRLFNLSYWKFI